MPSSETAAEDADSPPAASSSKLLLVAGCSGGVDWEGVRNLVNALPRTLNRTVLVPSIGVPKHNELPWRAGRLTDGPYTSYDLNTLIRATAGEQLLCIDFGDKLVAEACIQALDLECTEGQIFEINSVKGYVPGNDPEKWCELFTAAQIR